MFTKLPCLDPLVLLLPKLRIIWLSNLSILSVPDEGYSRNKSCVLKGVGPLSGVFGPYLKTYNL